MSPHIICPKEHIGKTVYLVVFKERSLFLPCSQICPRVTELERQAKELEEKLAIQKAENES